MIRFGLFLPASLNFTFNDSNFLSEKNLTVYKNVDEYVSSLHEFKIGVIDMYINEHSDLLTDEQKLLREVITRNSDHIIVHNMELYEDDVAYIKDTLSNTSNISFSISGIIHNDSVSTLHSLEWLSSTAFYNTELTNSLSTLRPFSSKEMYFDFLPGTPKPHRLKIASYIKNQNLDSKIISGRLFKKTDNIYRVDFADESLWNSGFQSEVDNPRPFDDVIYQGISVKASQIVPEKIYNSSCYSIVSETKIDNSFSFYTEKIAKPLLASRLFVVFSGKNYLKGLHKLGFKTFDGIIDESYDTIDDHNERWNAALEQVKYLCNTPQENILQAIKPIVTHNYRRILQYNWMTDFKHYIEDLFLKQ